MKQDLVFRLCDNANDYWGRLALIVRDRMLPYQWEVLNDRVKGIEPSHCIENFRIAARRSTGEYKGMVFQDSDAGKWAEALAWSLFDHRDPEAEAKIDGLAELLAAAQAEDGYLNSYFTVKEPGKRWTNLWECHELYSAGHLLEGALTYYEATGKRPFLDCMLKYIDHIGRRFGDAPGQELGYDGHEEIELALLRLYRSLGDRRHLDLARFFINQRGCEPNYLVSQWESNGHRSHWTKAEVGKPELSYFQAEKPVRQLTEAAGHAVRAVYLYTAMADLADIDGDSGLEDACRRLWDDITKRQMYVTGGIGSTHNGEAFTFEYDLPNETAYAETCASIGLVFFADRMMELGPRSEYADVVERILYNVVSASFSEDGSSFFYVNPMETWPRANAGNPDRRHVKANRQPWYSCACCPPNLARLICSLGRFTASVKAGTVYIHQYISGELNLVLKGAVFSARLKSGFPYHGNATLEITESSGMENCVALRVPAWASYAKANLNGQCLNLLIDENGYATINREWRAGDSLELDFGMEPRLMEADSRLRATAGQVCLTRGPLVYCFEQVDNGENLAALSVDPRTALSETKGGPYPLIRLSGRRRETGNLDHALYLPLGDQRGEAIELCAIPYSCWGRRGLGEMRVWMRLTPSL